LQLPAVIVREKEENELEGNELIIMSTLHDGENSIQAPSLIDTGVTGFAFIDENFACQHHFHTYKLQVPQDLEVIDR